jgi:hypothetical protein
VAGVERSEPRDRGLNLGVRCTQPQPPKMAFDEIGKLFPACSSASGSVTRNGPPLHLRFAALVGHQVRFFWSLRPASFSTCQIVEMATLGRPADADRSACRSVVSDQVAVPSTSGVGSRGTSRRIRSREVWS